MSDTVLVGSHVTVNGSGDLYFNSDIRPIIHEIVFVNRQCKNGLYEVVYGDKKYYVAKRNLDILSQ